MEKLWNKNYIKVMTANFALFFAFYVLTPLLPLYLSEHFGATKDVIGLVLSGYTISAFIVRPFSGFLVDSFPRKTVLLACYTAFAIFFAGYLAAGTLLMFTIVRTLHGGGFGAATVANSTAAIDVLPPTRRNEGIGYYGLSNNLAMAVAPSIGIYIYHLTNSFALLFWLALVVAFIGLAADASAEITNKDANTEEQTPAPSTRATKKATARRRRITMSLDRFFLLRGWLLAANMVFFGFCFGVLSNYLAIYSKEQLGIVGGTGVYFLICSVGLILSRLQGGRALRKGLLSHNAAEGIVLSMASYTLFALMPLLPHSAYYFCYYGSAILLGLGNGHMWPAFQNMMLNMAHHNERGTANSTILVSWDVGMGLGVLIGGVIAEHMGYAAAFWAVAIAHGVGVTLFFLATRSSFLQHKINTEVK